MRAIRTLLLAFAVLTLVSIVGCGGTDQRPEMPNAATSDRSADDMGLAAEDPSADEPTDEEGDAEPEEAAVEEDAE